VTYLEGLEADFDPESDPPTEGLWAIGGAIVGGAIALAIVAWRQRAGRR
jgi:hypothetical protein